ICAAIAALGFRNRGLKTRKDLYVLKYTKAPALIVECCFADDADDVKLYDPDKMARAIVKGITGQSVAAAAASSTLYRVQVGAYRDRANAEDMLSKLKKAGFEGFVTATA
ncbi:MAG: N-acetylmuramoyl-L-alanine amidase, partial [Oscillospiraceae bacterium]|nr:N-acetylmuramoyl-L-alanine amidase [Oscillospiraceae bacterium]